MELLQWQDNAINTLPLRTEVQLLFKAVEQGHASVELLCRLGNRLSQLTDYQAAADVYRQAITMDPHCFSAYYNLGAAMDNIADYREAFIAYQGALRINPENAEVHYRLGEILTHTGQYEAAKASLRQALALQADHIEAHNQLAMVWLRQGEAEAALAVCDMCLHLAPGNTTALALKSIALNELGDRDAARDLVDFDRFLRQISPDGHEGLQDFEAFNAELEQYLRTCPQLVFEPPGRSTHSGYQAVIHDSSAETITRLRAIIYRAVEQYTHELREEASHPFLANRPQRLALHMWGVVLGQNGHETPHIHPSAWLSGVYYVKIPSMHRHSIERHAGWIEFGRPYPSLGCTAESEVKRIQPREGMLLLFPSYFFHCTIPVASREMRISIAFDIYSPHGS